MATTRQHPLEKWAASCVDKKFEIAAWLSSRVDWIEEHPDDPGTVMHASMEAALVLLADELARGLSHIYRISPEIYDDVINSDSIDAATDTPLPYPILVIELQNHELFRAVAMTTREYLKTALEDALDKRWLIKNPVTKQVTYSAKRIVDAFLPEGTDEQSDLILTVVPKEKAQQITREDMAAQIDQTFLEQIDTLSKKLDVDSISRERLLDAMCVPVVLPPRALHDFVYNESLNQAMTLIEFVLAQTTEQRIVYAPDKTLKDNPKKKRCKNHIHEAGFVWTAAYKEYKAYMKSANKLGGTVRPHIRRGHFHRFWTGPKHSDERKLVTHWIPPTLVQGRAGHAVNSGTIITGKPR